MVKAVLGCGLLLRVCVNSSCNVSACVYDLLSDRDPRGMDRSKVVCG